MAGAWGQQWEQIPALAGWEGLSCSLLPWHCSSCVEQDSWNPSSAGTVPMGRTEHGSGTRGTTRGKNSQGLAAWAQGHWLSVSAVPANEELLAAGTVRPRDPGLGP